MSFGVPKMMIVVTKPIFCGQRNIITVASNIFSGMQKIVSSTELIFNAVQKIGSNSLKIGDKANTNFGETQPVFFRQCDPQDLRQWPDETLNERA